MSSSNLYPIQSSTTNNQIINNPSSSYFEPESQFILRMPMVKAENGTKKLHPSANALRQALINKLTNKSSTEPVAEEPLADDIKDRLSVELNTETRKGRIKFDDETFEARLVDLPCIVESLKTIDRKLFYKTADICQMLVCRTQDDPWTSDEEEMLKQNETNKKTSKQKKDSDKNSALNKYKWPHGLAPPLKNVRRKRFRKVAKKKIVDYAEIEKEVKQLFRADRDASKIDYEVLLVEGELDDEENNDENKNSDRNNSLNNEDEYEESNMELIGGLSDGNSCMDSVLDADSSKLSKPIKKVAKVMNADESNMSFVDDDSMMASQTLLTKNKLPETDAEDNTNLNTNNFDECTMDNSNLPEQSDKSTKHRTGFKDLFVKDVLGDLSSSEDDDNNDEDDDDEDEPKLEKTEKVVKSFKFNLDKNSIHMTSKDTSQTTFTIGEESNMSNFEDSNIGFGNEHSESEASNLDSSKYTSTNITTTSKTKNLDILDPNSRADDTDLDISLEATTVKKVDAVEDFNFSDLSSSNSAQGGDNATKTNLSAKLLTLKDELQKIRDDREKRENEIKNINNPVLKKHLTSRLNNLIEEENRKQAEIDEVTAELNE